MMTSGEFDASGTQTSHTQPHSAVPRLDPNKPEDLVRQFHEVYGLPILDGAPTVTHDRINMRMGLIAEEFAELVGAIYGQQARATIESAFATAVTQDDGTRDVVETADALGDLVYVIYGMAFEAAIPMAKVLDEIQASNMSKLDDDGKPIYREDGKVMKGAHYCAPNIRRALGIESEGENDPDAAASAQ